MQRCCLEHTGEMTLTELPPRAPPSPGAPISSPTKPSLTTRSQGSHNSKPLACPPWVHSPSQVQLTGSPAGPVYNKSVKKILQGRDSLCKNDTETIGNMGGKSILDHYLTLCTKLSLYLHIFFILHQLSSSSHLD